MINTIIAGKFLGEDGIAAIGSTNALMEFISGLFWGFGAGFSIFVARLFGEKNYEGMRKNIYSNCTVMACVIVFIALICIAFIRPIFAFLNVDKTYITMLRYTI